MNDRINSIDNMRFHHSNSDNDMGRFGRRQLDEKVEKEPITDFDSIFQKELKKVRKEQIYRHDI